MIIINYHELQSGFKPREDQISALKFLSLMVATLQLGSETCDRLPLACGFVCLQVISLVISLANTP